MSSDAEICTSALVKARQDLSISNLQTDNTTQARRMRRIYGPTLKRVTQMFPWWFSEKPVTLVALSKDAYDGFEYAYQVPGDVLEISKVAQEDAVFRDTAPGSDANLFKMFTSTDGLTKEVHTQYESAVALCITTVKTNNILDPLFLDYFEFELARQYANLAKVDIADRKLLLQELAVAKNEAMMSSAIQEDVDFDSNNRYVDARGE